MLGLLVNSVPITYVSRQIANISLEEQLDFPYDPFGPHEVRNAGADWRLRPSEAAYVLADARHYDTKVDTDTGSAGRIMRLGAPQQEALQMYRLKGEIADQLGVISNWTVASSFDHRTRAHRPEIMGKARRLDPETCMMINAKWKWQPPRIQHFSSTT